MIKIYFCLLVSAHYKENRVQLGGRYSLTLKKVLYHLSLIIKTEQSTVPVFNILLTPRHYRRKCYDRPHQTGPVSRCVSLHFLSRW